MSLYLFFIFLIFLMTWRIGSNLRALLKNLRWLARMRRMPLGPPRTKFILCIAAYREQAVIADTLQYLARLDYPKHLYRVVVATALEPASQSPSTQVVAEHAAQAINLEFPGLVTVVSYPHRPASKPKQLAQAYLNVAEQLRDANTYFAVFDADSRPELSTLRIVSDQIYAYAKTYGTKPPILQQLSLYLLSGKRNALAEGAAIHQSLWTLAHEITRFRKQSARVRRLRGDNFSLSMLWNARVANCIAHGLFIHGPHYREEPIPTEFLTEDWPYGFGQCALRRPVLPIPSFDYTESPRRLRHIYGQKATWFNPFFELMPFANLQLRRGSYANKTETYFLALQAYASMFVFLLHSLVWLGSLCLAVFFGWQYFLFWLALFGAYWFLPVFLYRGFARTNHFNLPASITAMACGSLYVLSHSVGPLWACVRWFLSYIKGGRPNRLKTEYT